MEKKIRLAKIICHSGYCSRTEAEKIIKMGRVTIDDNPYLEFTISNSQIGRIKIDGKPIQKLSLKVWCFYKPKGYVCSTREQYRQKSFFRILPKELPRVVSVGRLDIESEGLLILTNSPGLSNFMERPENKIERKYIVNVSGKIYSNSFDSLKSGITVKGIRYKGLTVKNLTNHKNNNVLEIKIYEGKNREIRKILSYFKLTVKLLKRVRYGPFRIEKLNPGAITEIKDSKLKKCLEKIDFKDANNFR